MKKNPLLASRNGTSFHNLTVKASLRNLKLILGEPEEYDRVRFESGYKVHYRWTRMTLDGEVFTVYDYRMQFPPSPDTVIEWHIGGHNLAATEKAQRLILSDLERYCK